MAPKHYRIGLFLQLALLLPSMNPPAHAQDKSAWEIFGGASFERADVRQYFRSSPIIYTARNRYANLRGWEASLTENVKPWLAGTLSFSGHYTIAKLAGSTANLATTPTRERLHSILYGPRFHAKRSWGTPFVHILMGVAHADARVTPIGPHVSDFAFAVAPGAGFDRTLWKNTGARIQAEYFRTNTLGTRHDNFRVSAGLVLHVGKRK